MRRRKTKPSAAIQPLNKAIRKTIIIKKMIIKTKILKNSRLITMDSETQNPISNLKNPKDLHLKIPKTRSPKKRIPKNVYAIAEKPNALSFTATVLGKENHVELLVSATLATTRLNTRSKGAKLGAF